MNIGSSDPTTRQGLTATEVNSFPCSQQHYFQQPGHRDNLSDHYSVSPEEAIFKMQTMYTMDYDAAIRREPYHL